MKIKRENVVEVLYWLLMGAIFYVGLRWIR